jgi:hypothetical protein
VVLELPSAAAHSLRAAKNRIRPVVLFDLWIREGKIIQIWDEHPGSYFLELRNNFFWV